MASVSNMEDPTSATDESAEGRNDGTNDRGSSDNDSFEVIDRGDAKIHVAGLEKRFESREGTVDALAGVNFAVWDGEFVCVVGPSGCGKTTLFRIIAGLEAATAGAVSVDGQRVDGPSPDRGMVFQDHRLFPWRTVAENVQFGLEQQALAEGAIEARTEEMLDLVGLTGYANQYPRELSGGMSQRVGIARAMAVDPAVLLMDEPFASVDAQTRNRLHEELLDIWVETGKTILFITHDVEEAVALADRVVVLDGSPGRVREVVSVDLDRPRSRDDDGFVSYERRLRGLIGDESSHVG